MFFQSIKLNHPKKFVFLLNFFSKSNQIGGYLSEFVQKNFYKNTRIFLADVCLSEFSSNPAKNRGIFSINPI